jgi:hypothetical protein
MGQQQIRSAVEKHHKTAQWSWANCDIKQQTIRVDPKNDGAGRPEIALVLGGVNSEPIFCEGCFAPLTKNGF